MVIIITQQLILFGLFENVFKSHQMLLNKKKIGPKRKHVRRNCSGRLKVGK